ncbi:MAG: hypothetical protein LBN21_05070, partial [Treponema sp.]|nr:hypothetical protein [Treponema sp.]
WNDLHPINKKDVGYRLALAADALIYKEENTAPGPMLRVIRREENTLVLKFENCGAGLTACDAPHVTVVSGKNPVRLPATIEGRDQLFIDLSAVNNPERVLYAWADNPADRQLYNAEGLPAIPFRVAI